VCGSKQDDSGCKVSGKATVCKSRKGSGVKQVMYVCRIQDLCSVTSGHGSPSLLTAASPRPASSIAHLSSRK